ncbi:MAG: hypothetical protein ABR529_10060 [Actinomycetota bacterium]
MMISDAWPGLEIGGKPECHIVAVGSMGMSRRASEACSVEPARGMSPDEMTCAIRGARLGDVLERLRPSADADASVAAYEAEDSRRLW